MIEVLSAAVALGALAWGWANRRTHQELEQRVNSLRSSHFRLAEESRREVEALKQRVQDLSLELRRRDGTLAFEPTMTVAEAYAIHPDAERVFATFHLGGCASCAVSPDETIAHAAASHGTNLDLLLAALNGLLSEGSDRVFQRLEQESQSNRQPNVVLQL